MQTDSFQTVYRFLSLIKPNKVHFNLEYSGGLRLRTVNITVKIFKVFIEGVISMLKHVCYIDLN